jgi:hypothetical protein
MGAVLWSVAGVGGTVGLATFPLAYATVGRTKSVFSVVAAGLVATVLGAWMVPGLLSVLSQWPIYSNNIGDAEFLIVLLIPVIAMFGAVAWVSARERHNANVVGRAYARPNK